MNPLADHLWQSTLFAVVVGLLTLALRSNRARLRHWLWLAASLKFLIPLSVLVALVGQIQLREAPQSDIFAVVDQVSQPFTSVATSPLLATAPPADSSLPAILLGIWACGFIGITCSSWVRLRRIRAAVRAASPVQLEIPIRTLSSRTLIEPGVFGMFQPVLLLPEGIFERLSPAQLEAVIAHELCHVRHRDNLIAAIHMFVETTFWFHPLVWWIGKRMVEERERACDEEVLRTVGEPRAYAEGILNVCKLYVESPLTCVSGVTGSNLKKRIEAIMTNRIALKLTFTKKVILAVAGTAVLALPIVLGIMNTPPLVAQSQPVAEPSRDKATPPVTVQIAQAKAPPQVPRTAPPQSVTEARVAFEEAAIKQRTLPGGGGGKGGSMPNGFPQACYGAFEINPRRFVINNTTVYQLIALAYGKRCEFWERMEESDAVSGGPRWIRSDRFDIQALLPEGTPSYTPKQLATGDAPKLQMMLQTLLAERFKLVLRRPMKESNIYLLTVAKGGSKLTAPKDGPSRGQIQMLRSDENGQMRPVGGYSGPGSMTKLVSVLAGIIQRPVTDQTGIRDDVNFQLQFVRPEEDCASCPTVFTALQEQAGLKLEAIKAPVEVFVIDRVERPSEN